MEGWPGGGHHQVDVPHQKGLERAAALPAVALRSVEEWLNDMTWESVSVGLSEGMLALQVVPNYNLAPH